MKKQISSRKWVISFFILIIAIFMILASVTYAVDPFFQYRVKDNLYMLNGWFVGSGLIKNYEYDTLMLGSSMTQNFDMDLMREKLDVQPLHIGLGGINSIEINELINLAYETDKAHCFYICVDLSTFTNDADTSRIPSHLINNNILSKCHYLLSYEPWFRYMPVDLCFMVLDQTSINLPAKFEYGRSIDRLEDWRLDVTFGEDIVLDKYRNGKYSVSEVDTNNLYKRMREHVDTYLSIFDLDKGSHIFFFPPYSSLYWCNAQNSNYFDTYIKAKEYFVSEANKMGAVVYDFQSSDLTMDLNNYKDTTHYAPEINDFMVNCFANHSFIVTENNYSEFQEKLRLNTNSFRREHADLFE